MIRNGFDGYVWACARLGTMAKTQSNAGMGKFMSKAPQNREQSRMLVDTGSAVLLAASPTGEADRRLGVALQTAGGLSFLHSACPHSQPWPDRSALRAWF